LICPLSLQAHAAGQLCEDMLAAASGARRWELQCLLGELRDQPALYEAAWAESDGRCALAMRMLGRRHQRHGRLQVYVVMSC
jgi:hypothetical protein